MKRSGHCQWMAIAASAWLVAIATWSIAEPASVVSGWAEPSSTDAPARRLRIAPYRATIAGGAEPRQPVTVTVRGPDGTIRGRRAVVADAAGAFRVDWFTDARRMRAGDAVEAELQRADPVAVVIPRVTASVDPDTDRVFGQAPAGATVAVSPAPAGAPAVVVMPDAGGRYEASFAGLSDLDARAAGSADVTLASGHAIAVDWAAVTLSVDLSLATAAGAGPLGREVRVELRERAMGDVDGGRPGAVVVAGSDVVPRTGAAGTGPAADWIAPFRDRFGQRVDIRPGDVVSVTIGDDRATIAVPRLEGAVAVDGDHVDVRADPGRAILVRVARGAGAAPTGSAAAAMTATAGPDGSARASFAGVFDIRYGDSVALRSEVGRHVFERFLWPAGLSLDLDNAALSGVAGRPGAAVATTVRQAGRLIERMVRADAEGRYEVRWQRRGAPIELQPGDRIAVTVAGPAGAAEATLALSVPELILEADPGGDLARGRATPGGALRVTVADIRGVPEVLGPGCAGAATGMQSISAIVDAAGAWIADFRSHFDVRAGTWMQVEYLTPEGHSVRRSRVVPWVNAQHGGAAVCGHADPRAIVIARLQGGTGDAKASGIGRADQAGAFSLVLADGAGRLAATADGDSVEIVAIEVGNGAGTAVGTGAGTGAGAGAVSRAGSGVGSRVGWGAGSGVGSDAGSRVGWNAGDAAGARDISNAGSTVGAPLVVDMPALVAQADWVAGEAVGRIPPGSDLTVLRPAGLCGGAARAQVDWLPIDREGAFRLPLRGDAPGDGLELALFTPQGHRVFRPLLRPSITAHVGRAIVAGRAAPLEHVRTVVARAGRPVADVMAMSGTDGGFAALLRSANGGPIDVRAGDHIVVEAAGASEAIEVEPLGLDWSPADAITVLAPPRRTVAIELWADDRLLVATDVVVDSSGVYRLAPGDLPRRSTWSLGDVTGVRAAMAVAGGHVLVAEAGAPGPAGPFGLAVEIETRGRGLPGRAVLPWVANR